MNRLIIAVILVISIFTFNVYQPIAVYASPDLTEKVLLPGSKGIDVVILQQFLNELGYTLVEDGIYGPQTKLALLDFQSNYPELTKDGIYGPMTRSYLISTYSDSDYESDDIQQCELNINDNLEKDKILTYNATIDGITNVVDQNFVEENRESLSLIESPCSIIREWNTSIPKDLKLNVQYNNYSMAYNYFLVMTNTLNVRNTPTTKGQIVKNLGYFQKVNLIQEVQGEFLPRYNSDSWYRVFWHENGEVNTGFVFSKLGTPRTYRFDKMLEEVKVLQNTIDTNNIGYIYNYKNVNGYPPAYNGKNTDSYDVHRSQSAPGYTDLSNSDFRYFSDGMMVSIIDEVDGYYHVTTPSFEGEYYIPKKYISFKNSPEQLNKVVVIDDTNQNEGVFQFINGHWELISYNYATTGVDNTYSFETPKGHFMAVQKKPYFLYLKDGTSEIGGFAPYTIRFSGGGYIHGVPIDFIEDQSHRNTDLTDTEIYEEYLFTIGTTPRSHKCVRNFTSHAKFLYDWADIGETAVIVIE